jgi:hypothetical protein
MQVALGSLHDNAKDSIRLQTAALQVKAKWQRRIAGRYLREWREL